MPYVGLPLLTSGRPQLLVGKYIFTGRPGFYRANNADEFPIQK